MMEECKESSDEVSTIAKLIGTVCDIETSEMSSECSANEADKPDPEVSRLRGNSDAMDVCITSDSDEICQNAPVHHVKFNFDDIKPIGISNVFSADDYLIGCKWSPDGSCLLTNCADYRLRLFDLPNQIYTMEEWTNEFPVCDLKPSLCVPDGGPVCDFDWYPHMSSWTPETCCFLSASAHAPVHLFDAFTGELRASYIGLNYAEEVSRCHSIKFSLDGDRIYCSYVNCVKIFDTLAPGTNCTTINTKQLNDQKGILSCISENPTQPNLFAVGSYRKSIGLYTVEGDSVGLLTGQKGGVTHLAHSNDGIRLFSGGRSDDEILCWDLRNIGSVLYSLNRTVKTNQRIYFDITPDGSYLVTGNTDGSMLFYDIRSESESCEIHRFLGHVDCVNGVSFNQKFPVLATASGQLHFYDIVSDEEDDKLFCSSKNLSKIENTIKLWWMGNVSKKLPLVETLHNDF